MKGRIVKYILFIIGSFISVLISVNLIFTHLHDGGQIGMIIGLFSFQLFFILAAYRFKWFIVLFLLLFLSLNIPFTLLCMNFIYYAFVNPENGTPASLEILGYALYFIFAFLLIETAYLLDRKYKSTI